MTHPSIRTTAPLGTVAAIAAVMVLAGCTWQGGGAPGAAVATGDPESQEEADEVMTQFADSMRYDLPEPESASTAAIDRAVPAVLDAWHATVTRDLVSASGPPASRRLLVRMTVDYVPSNTADWGPEPSEARVVRCFLVAAGGDPRSAANAGSAWRVAERACPPTVR